MAQRSEFPTPENHQKTEPLAAEIANLRNFFAPAAVLGTGTPSALERNSGGDTLVDRRSPLQLDSAFVQQTKDQIRIVVEAIATLAHSPMEPQDFVDTTLPKIANAMGASGAALWQQLPDNRWSLLGDFNLPPVLVKSQTEEKESGAETDVSLNSFERLDFLEAQLRDATQSLQANDLHEAADQWQQPSESHLSILNAVARERQPILIPPCEALLNRDRPANPTSELLIYAPLLLSKEMGRFWLQVVQSPSGGPASQRGYLRFVAQMADLMSDYFRSHRLRVFERDREYLSLAEHVMHELAGGQNAKQGIEKLMRTIRQHAHSEHAFLLRRESYVGRWKVVGAAGLIDIDRRAEGISLIERATSFFQSSLRNGGALVASELPIEVDERDPDLNAMMNTFAISELQWIKPLNQDGEKTRTSNLDVAVLLTWSGMDRPPTRCSEQTALISRLGLSALQVPWWKSALIASRPGSRYSVNPFNPATWPRVVKWIAALLMLSAVMAIPVPIQLHATAVLVPLVQQHVFAPLDATVEDVLVEHGQEVKSGEPLLKLRSPSLAAELEQTLAQQNRNAQRLQDIDGRLLRETTLNNAQREELEGERKAILSVQDMESRQLTLLRSQLASLSVSSSMDGFVSTWNVQDSLKDRPLRTGQWLLTIQESESLWILEATLPERDANEFRNAMEKDHVRALATLTSYPQVQLPVRLRQTTKPRIESRRNRETIVDPNLSVLRMQFEIDTDRLPEDIAVAGATARISIPVGRGPLIWALGKDFAYQIWSRIQLWI
jgi:multidrug efflux pump subunit AcrA (membrane-fusion protein)